MTTADTAGLVADMRAWAEDDIVPGDVMACLRLGASALERLTAALSDAHSLLRIQETNADTHAVALAARLATLESALADALRFHWSSDGADELQARERAKAALDTEEATVSDITKTTMQLCDELVVEPSCTPWAGYRVRRRLRRLIAQDRRRAQR
jgi:hypothetical protein